MRVHLIDYKETNECRTKTLTFLSLEVLLFIVFQFDIEINYSIVRDGKRQLFVI